ncbi:hypothetical protein MHH33_15660 [Paenisporosarcina sp. FSL H8-0542]|uniref:hypothetical protein n=1 Tax=Paenisporosarcina sp. FSL H8-0542 TaxID=2921401 RepID=UPI00315A57A3
MREYIALIALSLFWGISFVFISILSDFCSYDSWIGCHTVWSVLNHTSKTHFSEVSFFSVTKEVKISRLFT